MGTWIVIAIVVLVVLWLVFTYNGLVTARNRTQEAWSEIDVELKRRHDLIPNLVNTVQGYVGHERGTLEAVTNARAAAVAAVVERPETSVPNVIDQVSTIRESNFMAIVAPCRHGSWGHRSPQRRRNASSLANSGLSRSST